MRLLLFVVATVLLATVVHSYDEKLLRELVQELQSLKNIRGMNDGIEGNKAVRPPGAHEIPSDDDDDDDSKTSHDSSSDSSHSDDDDDDDDDKRTTVKDDGKGRGQGVPSETDIVRAILKHYADERSDRANYLPDYKACSREQPLVLSNQSGTVLSPGYFNKSYYNNLNCSWKLVALSSAKVLNVKVRRLNIPYSEGCVRDSLQFWDVRNGMPFLKGRYCGYVSPQELIQSSAQEMFVYFVSDSTENHGYFSFEYEDVNPLPPEPSNPDCGRPKIKPDVSQRIVNGRPAVPYSWPWQVSLRMQSGNLWIHACGGSIITPEIVITAAHCFYRDGVEVDKSTLRVVAGDYDQKNNQDGPVQVSNVERIIIHRGYDKDSTDMYNDITILIMKNPFIFNDHIGPVCIPQVKFELNASCWSTGWGDTQQTADMLILQQVSLPLVPQPICALNTYNSDRISEKQFCAGYETGGRETCQGDSGGPFCCYNDLNDRWYLHGIVSFGMGCGKPKKPGVYTRMTQYGDWFHNMTGVSP